MEKGKADLPDAAELTQERIARHGGRSVSDAGGTGVVAMAPGVMMV